MSPPIAERDWKLFRELHPIALERFCERVLADVARIASDPGKSAHSRYAEVYALVRERDELLAATFDAARRSTALMQLMAFRAQGLLTDEEFARFGPEARALCDRAGLGNDAKEPRTK